jgi:DNA-directed RNA polymerase specialized sigma24 family protein
MISETRCDCLICRLEASLVLDLSGDVANQEFRSFAQSSPTLAGFSSPFDLIERLHRSQDETPNQSSDEVIIDLVRRRGENRFGPMWRRILLLVFIPTIHRTTTRITATFPSLGRDDIAQHLLATLLDFLGSQEIGTRHSHLAFITARKIRRSAFRWAIRESHRSLQSDAGLRSVRPFEAHTAAEDSFAYVLLHKFLDNCQQRGWLSTEERELLTQFKLQGISAAELARRNGHSATAIRHRVQRVLDRLRRLARQTNNSDHDQLNLFER